MLLAIRIVLLILCALFFLAGASENHPKKGLQDNITGLVLLVILLPIFRM